jgi:hypothetical protein
MIQKLLMIAVVVAGIGGYFTGVRLEAGRQAIQLAKAQQAVVRAAEAASVSEEKRLAAEFQRAQSMIQLEDEANADTAAGNMCLGADSVMRLNRR